VSIRVIFDQFFYFSLDVEPVLRWNTTGITVGGVTGQLGNATNKLYYPMGLYVDWANTLYIADQYNNRIQKYVRSASFGTTIAGDSTGLNGSALSCLYYPADVTVDSNGNIYVSDAWNHRVQLWNYNASAGTTIAGITGLIFYRIFFLLFKIDVLIGSPGNALNQLNDLRGIVRNLVKNAIYVADCGNHRVMYYGVNATNGTIVAGGNGPGPNVTQLWCPYGIHFDDVSNSLIIANLGAHNIIRWKMGAPRWMLVAGTLNGTNGTTSSSLQSPRDVILDPMGNAYIADSGNHRVVLFYPNRSVGKTIVGITNVIGNNASLFNYPISIAFDNQLNLYVSDYENHRIQKFLRY